VESVKIPLKSSVDAHHHFDFLVFLRDVSGHEATRPNQLPDIPTSTPFPSHPARPVAQSGHFVKRFSAVSDYTRTIKFAPVYIRKFRSDGHHK